MTKMFGKYLQQKKAQRRLDDIAASLYILTVNHARNPVFFLDLGVPDTVDGRFEMIALHAHLVMRRLKDMDIEGAKLAQAYFDAMFHDMDRNLRELGVSDMAVGKRMKKMLQGFYGRVAAYDEGLASTDPAELQAAIARNVYGTVEAQQSWLVAMAAYTTAIVDRLDGYDLAVFEEVLVDFPLPN
jgi:cytochrome b pre-mRNA-processing protein 3